MVNWAHRQRLTPWGRVTEETFKPTMNLQPLRCPACSLLFEPGFLMQNKCPNCNMTWGLKTKRDMIVEDLQLSVIGGWDKHKLDILTDKNAGSSTMTKDGTVKEMDKTAQAMAAAYAKRMEQEKYLIAQRGALAKRYRDLQKTMTMHSPLNQLR